MRVAVLCVAPRSVYKELLVPGLDIYDKRRDCRSYKERFPVVCHPPCSPWSRHCRHQAHFTEGDIDAGRKCVDLLLDCGGVLEQPAGSLLFERFGLPLPGCSRGSLWTVEVWQAWWGYPLRKATWLCFCGVPRGQVHFPLRLHARGSDRRAEQLMSHAARSRTTVSFAEWLISCARLAG